MVTLASNLDTPAAVTTRGNLLVWAEAGGMTTYSSGDASFNEGTLGRVMKANIDGSNAKVVADSLVEPIAVAVDDSNIYWADAGTVGGVNPAAIAFYSDGALMRAPVNGGAPETLVPSVDAQTLALSSDAVFFSSFAYGLVFRVSK
jgi:hypothetical protein